MKFDHIYSNPPYSIGNKITTEAKKHANKTVCLMPLSCYKNKSNELWRYVESMELADPKMFEDATITDNLCICTLMNETVDKFRSYDEMSMKSYDPKFRMFYEVNGKYTVKYDLVYCPFTFDEYNVNNTFITHSRIDDGRIHGKNDTEISWNIRNEQLPIPTRIDTGRNRSSYSFIKIGGIAKNNFATWWYSKNGDNLSRDVVAAMNLGGGCRFDPAIPQIDWETISDTPLWKEGKYDEAVLDVMGLKWDGDVIVEERKL